MTLRDFTSEEWDTLRQELRAFRGTLLHRAMLAYLADFSATCAVTLEARSTSYDDTQFVRGQLTGLDTLSILLDDLERRATRKTT